MEPLCSTSWRRLVQSRLLGSAGNAALDVRLTGTRAEIHDALLAAVLGVSPSVVLTEAAGLGKATVLLAALSCLAEPERQVLWPDEGDGIERAFSVLFASARQRPMVAFCPSELPSRLGDGSGGSQAAGKPHLP